MSSKLLGLAFNADMGSHCRKLVLLRICDFCHEDGSKIFPALSSIATAAQCAVRTVQREIRAMTEVGLLRVVREGGKGAGSTTEYALDVGMLRVLAERGWAHVAGLVGAPLGDDQAQPEDEGAEVAEGNMGDTMSPFSPNKGDTMSPIDPGRVTPATNKGDTSVTQPLKEPLEGLRERRAREGSDNGSEPPPVATEPAAIGPIVPDRDLLDKAVATHPDSAHDDLWSIEAAWLTLTPAERREAVDRLPDWVGDRKGRKVILGLPKYLAQKAWTRLPDKPAAGPAGPAPAGGKSYVPPFDRPWWVLWVEIAERNPQEARRRASGAKTGIGWMVEPGELPSEERQKAFVAVPVDGPEITAWTAWYRRRGIELPLPDKAQWVFMPSAQPPVQQAERAREEIGL